MVHKTQGKRGIARSRRTAHDARERMFEPDVVGHVNDLFRRSPRVYIPERSDVLSFRRLRFKNDTLYVLSSGSLIRCAPPSIFLRLILFSVRTITVSSSFLFKIMSFLFKIHQLRGTIIKCNTPNFTDGLAFASRRIVRIVRILFRACTDHFHDYFVLFNSDCI